MKNSLDRDEFINQRNRVIGLLLLISAVAASITQTAGGLPLYLIMIIVSIIASTGIFLLYSSIKNKFHNSSMYIAATILTIGGLAEINYWEFYTPIFISLVLVSLYENWKIVVLNVSITLLLFFLYFQQHVEFNNIRDFTIFGLSYFLIGLIIFANTFVAEKVRTRANLEHQELNESKDEIEKMLKKSQDSEETLEKQTKELQLALDTLQLTQKQLVEAEKMSALGNLVAGIAHEINTPLGIGVTATSHLNQKTREFVSLYNSNQMKKKDLSQFINTVNESTNMIYVNLERASELIRSFKQVAVDQSSEIKRTFNLKEYIGEILLSLRPRLKHTKITVMIDCPDDLEIFSYPGQISQILTNLIVNALTHAFKKDDVGEIYISVEKHDQTITLLFKDTGRGMPKHVVEKVFDPFFTTNRGNGGTGLGMHIIYNIVTQRLNGNISCTTKLGEGSQFEITLPYEEEVYEKIH